MIRDLFKVVDARADRYYASRPLKKKEPLLKLRKAYENHIVMECNIKLGRMKRLAEELENTREILAVEWFDK
jgi:hypothetical protein